MDNDLISRSELLGKFMAMLTFSSDRVVLIENVIEQIQNAPTVEQPQGEWVNTSSYDDKGVCSLCCYWSKKYYNFCPNCGARMKQG